MNKKNNFKIVINKIIGIIFNLLIAVVLVLIIIGIYYLVQIKVLKNNYGNIFGYTFFEVATGSMADTIEVGDAVIVKVTKEVQEDDIIVYKDGDNFITHRLIEINDNGELITKGDANNTEDDPITKEQVLGKVIKIIPKLGIIKNAILSPRVLILITILIILLGISFKITSKTEEKSKD